MGSQRRGLRKSTLAFPPSRKPSSDPALEGIVTRNHFVEVGRWFPWWLRKDKPTSFTHLQTSKHKRPEDWPVLNALGLLKLIAVDQVFQTYRTGLHLCTPSGSLVAHAIHRWWRSFGKLLLNKMLQHLETLFWLHCVNNDSNEYSNRLRLF